MTWACASCQGENPEGMRFCGHCGAPRPAAPAVAEPHPPTPAAPDERADETLRAFITGQVADRLVASGGQLTEERRLVTALFADLSGFTPLSERLDAEELLEVIDPIIRELSDIVGRYEGFVEKFAGDALLALFGAPVAHEDDAVRAVLTAAEMHRTLARLRTALGDEASDLTLHIGINTGHGVARMIGSQVRLDYAVLGDSVVLAQRLESAAPPGETYLGETTQRLVRERFELEPVGPLTLKGKARPVPAWRMVGEARETAAVSARVLGPLVGREQELDAAAGVLDALADGAPGLISILGDAGVGKSRLMAELRRLADERAIRWLDARCLSYGVAIPYWPYADLVRRLARVQPSDSASEALVRLREFVEDLDVPTAMAPLAQLIGSQEADGTPVAIDPEVARRALHEAVRSVVHALARHGPVVLTLEDLHWSDPSSIALTAELGRPTDAPPIIVLLTSRPGGSPSIDEVAAAAHPTAHLALHLQPLEPAAIARIAEALLGGAAPRELESLLTERAAGNPFFAEEIVRSLLDAGHLVRTDGRWGLAAAWDPSDVPATVEGVLASRIDALPQAAAMLLGVASVIGRRVRLPLLHAVAEGVASPHGMPVLISAGLLDDGAPEDLVAFHHALVQDVAYSRLLRRRRRSLHLRTADAAERLFGARDDTVDLLARHLYLGGAGARAVPYLLRAAQRAASLYANAEAIGHLERAVELIRAEPTAGDLAGTLTGLAELLELVGSYDAALMSFSEAREGAGQRAWRGVVSTLRRLGRYDEALAAAEAAMVAIEDDLDVRPIWLERLLVLSAASRPSEATAAGESALAMSDAMDLTRARLLLELARIGASHGSATEALAQARQAEAIFREADDVRGLATALRTIGDVADEAGDLHQARLALIAGIELAERTGNVEELGACLINLGVVEQELGDLEAAIAADRRASEEFERIGHGGGRVIALGNLADKLASAGRVDEAEPYARRALAGAEALNDPRMRADITDTLAAIDRHRGDYAAAAQAAEAAAELFSAAEVLERSVDELRAAAGDWRAAGDPERAAALEARLVTVSPP